MKKTILLAILIYSGTAFSSDGSEIFNYLTYMVFHIGISISSLIYLNKSELEFSFGVTIVSLVLILLNLFKGPEYYYGLAYTDNHGSGVLLLSLAAPIVIIIFVYMLFKLFGFHTDKIQNTDKDKL